MKSIFGDHPPKPVGDPEFPFTSQWELDEWIRQRAIWDAWQATQEAKAELDEMWGPGRLGKPRSKKPDDEGGAQDE